MPETLAGRRILVTGGGRGIGRSIALACAREGARVAITARSADQLAAVAKEIQAEGSLAVPLVCDVGDVGQVERMVGEAVAALGGVDVLVNNAGGGTEHAPVAESTPDLWVACIAANLVGTYACTRFVLPGMIAGVEAARSSTSAPAWAMRRAPAACRTVRQKRRYGCSRSASHWRCGNTAST